MATTTEKSLLITTAVDCFVSTLSAACDHIRVKSRTKLRTMRTQQRAFFSTGADDTPFGIIQQNKSLIDLTFAESEFEESIHLHLKYIASISSCLSAVSDDISKIIATMSYICGHLPNGAETVLETIVIKLAKQAHANLERCLSSFSTTPFKNDSASDTTDDTCFHFPELFVSFRRGFNERGEDDVDRLAKISNHFMHASISLMREGDRSLHFFHHLTEALKLWSVDTSSSSLPTM
jgi:hypothetical protein